MRAKVLINKRLRRIFQYTAIILCFLLCIYYVIIYSNYSERTNLKRHFRTKSFHDTERSRRLKKMLHCERQVLVGTTTRYGNDYRILPNYIRGSISAQLDCADSVTYTTTTDYGYLSYLPALVLRWLAPISLSLHAPGDDFNTTMNCIQYLRNCLPESILIRQYVTFHIYFPIEHTPADVPKGEDKALKWPYNCTVQWPPYENVNRSVMYKTVQNAADSVNLGHNIARLAANTHFVLQADIELIPSVGLAEQFLDMVSHNQRLLVVTAPRVFALPVFEVLGNAALPITKERLEVMLKTNLAMPLHRNICPDCHMMPKYSEWVNATLHELSVLAVVRREETFSHWEPYFISDNKDPWFNTLFMWPGKSDRRVQGYDMCLLEYEYFLLHPAFLMQRPSLKYQDLNSNSAKKNYESITKLIRKKILPDYIRLFGINRTKQCTGLSSELWDL